MKEAGTYISPEWHHRASPVVMMEEMMTAFDTYDSKTGPGECGNEVGAGDAGSPAHAAMVTRWMPTNSNSCSGAPSTSRQSSIASRMRCMTSSRDRPCVPFRISLNDDIELP